jgi:signal transduction histidine kinase
MKLWLYQLKQTVARDPVALGSCAVLEEEMGRLEELATSFLQFSRPPSLQRVPIHMSEVIDGTLALARHRLDEKKLRLVHINGTPMPRILADAHQLRQVVLNLIMNAIDASPEGGTVRITESCEPGESGHSKVVLRIQDDGPGIPEGVRPRLFEAFVTSKPNGTGLGLAVASSIVAEHGGDLVLEPSHGSGAAFAVRLSACDDLD